MQIGSLSPNEQVLFDTSINYLAKICTDNYHWAGAFVPDIDIRADSNMSLLSGFSISLAMVVMLSSSCSLRTHILADPSTCKMTI